MISVRVGDELKRRMAKYRHVNWSEVVRRAIRRELEELEARNLAKALLLNETYTITPEEGFSSVKEIRKWRESRR